MSARASTRLWGRRRTPPSFETHVRREKYKEFLERTPMSAPPRKPIPSASNPPRPPQPLDFIHSGSEHETITYLHVDTTVTLWDVSFSFGFRWERGQKQLSSKEPMEGFLFVFRFVVVNSGCSVTFYNSTRELPMPFGMVPESPRPGSFPGIAKLRRRPCTLAAP